MKNGSAVIRRRPGSPEVRVEQPETDTEAETLDMVDAWINQEIDLMRDHQKLRALSGKTAETGDVLKIERLVNAMAKTKAMRLVNQNPQLRQGVLSDPDEAKRVINDYMRQLPNRAG